jgi:hypothetical protein
MISAFKIRDTIENFHQRFAIDFKDINRHNYREHLARVLNDEGFGEGLNIFAYYSRAIGAPNIHVNNYISQLSRTMVESHDLESLIAFDDFIYDEDYVHHDEQDYLLSETISAATSFYISAKYEKQSILLEFYNHYLEKYYGFEKSLSFTSKAQLQGTIRYVDQRFSNIIMKDDLPFSDKEYVLLRKLSENGLFGSSLVNKEFETYVINRAAFEGSSEFISAMKLMSDLTSNGVISHDILAKNICFASDSDFAKCLESMAKYSDSFFEITVAYNLTIKYEAKYNQVSHKMKERRTAAVGIVVDRAIDQLGGLEEISIDVNKSLNVFDIKDEPIQADIINRLLERSKDDKDFFSLVLNHFCKQSDPAGISAYFREYPALKAALPLLSTEQKRSLISEDFGL